MTANRWLGGRHLGHLTLSERVEDLGFAMQFRGIPEPFVEDPEAGAIFEAMTADPGWLRYRIGAMKRPATSDERHHIDRAVGAA